MDLQRRERILDWTSQILDGVTPSEIAKNNNLSRQFVYAELSLLPTRLRQDDNLYQIDHDRVRDDYMAGASLSDLTRKYHITRDMAKGIISEKKTVLKAGRTEELLRAIQNEWAEGWKLKEIAEKHSMSIQATGNLIAKARRLGFSFPKKSVPICKHHESPRLNGLYAVDDACPHAKKNSKGKLYSEAEFCRDCPSKEYYQ